jgi:dihydrofolate reductase
MSVLLTFTMSLDGFIAGPNVSKAYPMGEGGESLHEWLFKGSASEPDASMSREMLERGGATVLGKRTYVVGLPHWNDTPYPTPSFVLTHEKRAPQAMKSASFVFVNDGIASAVEQARFAAGEKDVILMGAEVSRQALRAGLVDEIFIQLSPLLLGGGTRLFEGLDVARIRLDNTRTVASPCVTHLRYKVTNLRAGE